METTVLREKPGGYKPSKRHWNELEQTPTQLGYTQPGTPEYRKFYRFAAQVFDAEAHHMVDLGYIDKMLYKAGFTTGAKGTQNYSEARQRILENLRQNGIDVGNVEENIAPLSKKNPKYNKTGIAHTFVHDAYNKIPEASDEFLRSLDENAFTKYLIEKARQRKDYVAQALEHKHNALMAAHPELKQQSPRQIREWIHANKQEFGSLGDETLQLNRRNPAPVQGQPRGRVSINPIVNDIYRNTPKQFLSLGAGLPMVGLAFQAADAKQRTEKAIKTNDPWDKVQAGLSTIGTVFDPADWVNQGIDAIRNPDEYKWARDNLTKNRRLLPTMAPLGL